MGGETRVRCRRRGQKRGAIGEDAKLGSTSNTRIRRKRSLAPVKRGRPHAGGRTDFHNTSSPQGHDVPLHGTRGGNRAGGGSSPEVPQPPPKCTRVELVMGTDSHKHGHSRRCSLFEDFSLFFSPLPRGFSLYGRVLVRVRIPHAHRPTCPRCQFLIDRLRSAHHRHSPSPTITHHYPSSLTIGTHRHPPSPSVTHDH